MVGEALGLSCQWQNPKSWVSSSTVKRRTLDGIRRLEWLRGQYRGTSVMRCGLRSRRGGTKSFIRFIPIHLKGSHRLVELFGLMIRAMVRSHKVAVDELAMSGMAVSNREVGRVA